MAITTTFSGVVRDGHIESSAATELPEGSQVVVLATDKWDDSPLIDPYIARQKANGWLVSIMSVVLLSDSPNCNRKKDVSFGDSRHFWLPKAVHCVDLLDLSMLMPTKERCSPTSKLHKR